MKSRCAFVLLFFLMTVSVFAEHWITVDNETGCILEEHGRNSRVSVASLTKVAMAMVVLDWATLSKKSLDMVVEIPSSEALQAPENRFGLQAGDRLSLRDLLYLSLLASDNVAAETIAAAVGKQLPNVKDLEPVDNFISQMNALASELQMKDTLFLNPSGHDMPSGQVQPYSTAADLARLARYAYSKPGLAFYVAQKARGVHVERAGKSFTLTIRNTNVLLGQEAIDGVKTGLTVLAGGCLLLTSEHTPEVKKVGNTVYTAPRRIIVVVLNAADPFQEGLALIRRGWSLYDAWAGEGRLTQGYRFL